MTTTVLRPWSWPGLVRPWGARAAAPAAAQPSYDGATASRPARDRRLATVLSGAELAWLLDERFDAERETWTVDVLRYEHSGGWRRQRYKYDAADDVLYFWGECRIPEAEALSMDLRALKEFELRPAFVPRAGEGRAG